MGLLREERGSQLLQSRNHHFLALPGAGCSRSPVCNSHSAAGVPLTLELRGPSHTGHSSASPHFSHWCHRPMGSLLHYSSCECSQLFQNTREATTPHFSCIRSVRASREGLLKSLQDERQTHIRQPAGDSDLTILPSTGRLQRENPLPCKARRHLLVRREPGPQLLCCHHPQLV